tara:strand:+ start:3732 stop:4892 length:1161 start_codon:yes stop_codon:yes gene_type:complete
MSPFLDPSELLANAMLGCLLKGAIEDLQKEGWEPEKPKIETTEKVLYLTDKASGKVPVWQKNRSTENFCESAELSQEEDLQVIEPHREIKPEIGKTALDLCIGLYTYVGNNPINFYDPLGANAVAKFGTKVATRFVGRNAADLVTVKTVRGLFQGHHIIPKQVFAKHGKQLAELGFERDAFRNLISLPKGKVEQLVLNTKRSMHKGFSKNHELYNDGVMQQVDDVIGKYGSGALTKAEASNSIRSIQMGLREGLRDGSTKLLSDTSIRNIGKTGMFVIGGTFLGVTEGSAADKYFRQVRRFQREYDDFMEAKDLVKTIGGKHLMFETHFPDSWLRHIDWVNPVGIVQGAIELGGLPHIPSVPEMPEELRKAFEDLEAMGGSSKDCP